MQQFMLDWCSEWPLEQVFLTVGQNNFGNTIPFLTCFWRFLRSNKLEQLEFKLEKVIELKKHAGKVKKS